MRRLVVLVVLVFVGAALYGVSGASSGIAVNGQRVSAETMRAELRAISHHNTLQCYVTALDPMNFAPGAGGYSIAAAGAAAWSNLRVEGIAIDQYVTGTLHYHPSASALASAESSLESEMTEQASANSLKCPGTSKVALAQMPAEMRQSEIVDQAASLYLVSRIQEAIPLTVASMKKYFAEHRAAYDTLCVAVALVPLSAVKSFAKGERGGESLTSLVKQFSLIVQTTGDSGADGCYSPSSTDFSMVRGDASSGALNTFPTQPQYIKESDGTYYALYVAVTKRTANTYAAAAPVVLEDLRALNASSANNVKSVLLESAAIHVDPAFGRWGVNTTGPDVFAPAHPAKTDVLGAKRLATAGATYQ